MLKFGDIISETLFNIIPIFHDCSSIYKGDIWASIRDMIFYPGRKCTFIIKINEGTSDFIRELCVLQKVHETDD